MALACKTCRALPLLSFHWLTLFDPSSVRDDASDASSHKARSAMDVGENLVPPMIGRSLMKRNVAS